MDNDDKDLLRQLVTEQHEGEWANRKRKRLTLKALDHIEQVEADLQLLGDTHSELQREKEELKKDLEECEEAYADLDTAMGERTL